MTESAMLTFGLLSSLGMILFGLAPVTSLRYGGPALLLLVAVMIGYTTWPFFAFALCYLLLTAWMVEMPVRRVLTGLRYGVWFVASAALVAHAVPGYQGLMLADQVVLKEGSIATNLYFNHDKVLVAWSLLTVLPLFGMSMRPGEVSARWLVPVILLAGLLSVLALAVGRGLIDWQPGLPPWFWVFAFGNLLNTCIAEELVFRGLVQRYLAPRVGPLMGLGGASLLFGVAHFAGGWGYVLVASGAGLVYGLAYYWTGRLIWAVLVHWLLNLMHILLFTYPMSAT